MKVIKPLTSLRFFAALMVLASHYWKFEAGFAGVTFFYVLSGYVLAINYAGKLVTQDDRRLFWWKRFARIYPTHLITFLLAVPLGGSLIVALPNLLLLQSWVPSKPIYFAFNAPSWSISDEAAFYAVFPFLMAALAHKTWHKLAVWAVLFIALLIMWNSAFPTWTIDQGSVSLSIAGRPLTAPLTHFIFYIFPPVRLIEFAIGIGLAIGTVYHRLGSRAEFLALSSVAASFFVYYSGIPASFAASAVFIPSAAFLVLVFSRSDGVISKALSLPALVALGDASFMLYMIHWPLLVYDFTSPLMTALIAVVLSLMLHFGFEKPVQRFLVSVYPFRRHPAPEVEPSTKRS